MKSQFLLGLLVALILISLATWLALSRTTEDLTHITPCANTTEPLFITPQGEVTDALVRLLGLTGIRVEEDLLTVENDWPEARIHLKSRKLEEVVSAVQGKLDPFITWFGDPSKERWEEDPKKPKLSRLQANHIIDICLGSLRQGEKMLSQVPPKAILFLGAALTRVRMRLAYLNELYDQKKLSTDLPVYIMAGERKLDESIGETQENLMDSGNGIVPFRKDWTASQEHIIDEGEMVKLVFSQSRHRDLAEKNVIIVYSPKGQGRRATTETNLKQWLKEHSPLAGKYLAISNQPYNYFQECVIRRVLLQAGRSDICVEVVGPGMEVKVESDEAAIDQAKNLLNNLSRILYELQEIRKFRMSDHR